MNIYFINSPFQLYNALNFSQDYKGGKYELLVLICRNRENLSQTKAILQEHRRFDRIIDISYLSSGGSDLFSFPIRLIGFGIAKVIFFLLNYRNSVILGDAHYNKIVHLVKWSKVKQLILLDDGFLTFSYDIPTVSRKLRIADDKISLYSVFDLNDEKMVVIKNRHSYFMANYVKDIAIITPYFVGQPVVELNLISFEHYLEAISKCYLDSKVAIIKYICHRGEDKEKLKLLKEYFSDAIELITLNKSLEFELLAGFANSRVWYGLYSTALFWVKSVLDDKISVKAIDVTNKVSSNDLRSKLPIIYNQMLNKGITVLK